MWGWGLNVANEWGQSWNMWLMNGEELTNGAELECVGVGFKWLMNGGGAGMCGGGEFNCVQLLLDLTDWRDLWLAGWGGVENGDVKSDTSRNDVRAVFLSQMK